MTITKEYLGDGVYIDYDQHAQLFILTSENGIVALDTIYIDTSVLDTQQNEGIKTMCEILDRETNENDTKSEILALLCVHLNKLTI